jgi:hypothetical protein
MATIKLQFPFKKDGIEITEVEMRRPTVGDMRAASMSAKTDEEREITLFARLCGMNPEDFDAMDMKDYGRLQEEYTGFLS